MLIKFLKRLLFKVFHTHKWYYLTYKEWVSLGRGKTNICIKCGERRDWCDT